MLCVVWRIDVLIGYPSPIVGLKVLRYLLPASGLPEQNDAHASLSDDRRLLGYSHLHLLPAHHAGLEQHRHRQPGESCSVCVLVLCGGGAKNTLHLQRKLKFMITLQTNFKTLLLFRDGVAGRGEIEIEQNVLYINIKKQLVSEKQIEEFVLFTRWRKCFLCRYGNNINTSDTNRRTRPLTPQTLSQAVSLFPSENVKYFRDESVRRVLFVQ